MDIARIGQIARKYEVLFVVDAFQKAGIFPIDVQKCRSIFYVSPDTKAFWVPKVPADSMYGKVSV